jgi:beta-lactamase class A
MFNKMSPFFSKKLSIAYTAVFVVVSSIITFVITSFINNKQHDKELEFSSSSNSCNYKVKRLDGYSYIKPLMFVDDECEGDNLAMTKQEINEIIQNYKTMQGVISASVYIRDYSSGTWTSVNDELQYEPGSLFKVPILIAYLKMSEEKPGVLEKELDFNTPFAIDKNVAFRSKGIQLGHKYKIRELLKYMIAYSDNKATALLNNNLKPEVLTKLFADLNLEIPDIKAQHYYFTAKQYSLFMRALYNASYLSIDNSEFAAELLGTCDFKDGIVSGIPKGTKIAHKFGESGTPTEMQLHESAIIYVKDKPYLLTVMTKGKDNKTLSKLIGEISSTVYKNMINQ